MDNNHAELVKEIREGNQELKEEIHGLGVKMDSNHAELVEEISSDNKSVAKEMRMILKLLRFI